MISGELVVTRSVLLCVVASGGRALDARPLRKHDAPRRELASRRVLAEITATGRL